ncbi:MAG: hypothetical protein ACRCYO_10975, partial [Bacteroidia bacterium]
AAYTKIQSEGGVMSSMLSLNGFLAPSPVKSITDHLNGAHPKQTDTPPFEYPKYSTQSGFEKSRSVFLTHSEKSN